MVEVPFAAPVVGNTDLVGLDRLNPQLQEFAIPTRAGLPRGKADGTKAPSWARTAAGGRG